MAFSSLCPTQNFPAILECQLYVIIDIASSHALEIQHTGLWPVLVRILECPLKWEKSVPVNMQIADRTSDVRISFYEVWN